MLVFVGALAVDCIDFPIFQFSNQMCAAAEAAVGLMRMVGYVVCGNFAGSGGGGGSPIAKVKEREREPC